MEMPVIMLTRLNGPPFALNPDLIERADATPDTVITLVGGTKYVVAESLEELRRLVCEFRTQVITAAHTFESSTPAPRLRVVAPETQPEKADTPAHPHVREV
jgi:flagellar protein FlbD